MVSLVLLSGCSGCESRTSPTVSQSNSSPASEQTPAEKRSDTAEQSNKQDESAIDAKATGGEPADADSDATSSAEGETKSSGGDSKAAGAESNRSSAPQKASGGSDGGQQGSSEGEGTRDGRRSGSGAAENKTKPASQTGKPSSPGEAVATAQTLKLRSDKAAAGKEYGQAFELAAKAWESVQTFPKDAKCRELSNDLQRRLDELGTLANAQRGSDLKRDKPLIVR